MNRNVVFRLIVRDIFYLIVGFTYYTGVHHILHSIGKEASDSICFQGLTNQQIKELNKRASESQSFELISIGCHIGLNPVAPIN